MTRRPSREFLIVAGLCVAALAIRLTYVLTIEPRIFWYDGEQYSRLATGLIQHGAYVDPDGRPSAYWPPGYPFLLALVYAVAGVNVLAVRIVQAVIGALTVALTYGIAKRAVDPAGAWLAAGASALYPLFIYSSGAFFPVTLQVALVASAVYLVLVALERGSNVAAMGAGACSGWAILTTGSALPAMLLVAPWMMWSATKRKGALPGASQESGAGGSSGHGTATRPAGGSWARGARLALVYLIPIVVIVGAWTCRNQMRFGHPVMISTNGGYNLWLGNYPGATASTGNRYDQPGMEAEAAKVWYGLEDEVPRDHAFYRLAVGHIRADIPHFIRLSLSKALELWALYAQPVTQDRPRLGFEKLASILSYGVLLPLALIWLVRAIPRSPLAVLVLGFFIAYTAFHAVILAKVRFRLPVDSFVIIYGCGAAGALLRRLRRR